MKILDTEDWVVEDADFAFDMIPIADRFSVQILSTDMNACVCHEEIKKHVCVMTMNSILHHILTYEFDHTLYFNLSGRKYIGLIHTYIIQLVYIKILYMFLQVVL